MMHIYEMQSVFIFFIMAVANILFPKCKFSIGSVFPSPHYFILGSVSTFKNDDVSMLKTFMHGHSHMMTFMHISILHINIHK